MTAHIRRAAEIRAMVEQEPGITSAEVARRLGVSPASVSLALAELKAGGDVRMVQRGKAKGLHPSDKALRRRYLVQLRRL